MLRRVQPSVVGMPGDAGPALAGSEGPVPGLGWIGPTTIGAAALRIVGGWPARIVGSTRCQAYESLPIAVVSTARSYSAGPSLPAIGDGDATLRTDLAAAQEDARSAQRTTKADLLALRTNGTAARDELAKELRGPTRLEV